MANTTENDPAMERTRRTELILRLRGVTNTATSVNVSALMSTTAHAKRDRTLVTSITPMCVTCQLIASRPCPARYLRTGAFPTGIHMAIALSVEATKKNAKIRS